MKKPTTMSTKYQEDIYETYTAGAHAVDGASPYLHDNSPPDSDNESLSDSSRKIRKKRNTYQKISDDIRVQLLDAVQNGETLKSAAKRHKINYSSAKSILHTYRKEGRILKKSAQERTTKKRVSSTDIERRPSKLSRKENMEPDEDDEVPQNYVSSKDKQKHDDESEEKNHVMGLLNSSHYDHHDHHDIQAATEAAAPGGHHAYPKSDGPLTVRKHENVAEKHHSDYHKGVKAEHHGYKPRSYDAAHMTYHDGHDADHHAHYAGHHHAHHQREAPECTNYYFSRELDSFNDAVNMWQARSAHQDPSAFMSYHRYAMPNHLDTVHNTVDHDDHPDSSVGYLLKSFMDIQGNHYHHQPLRKSSFVSYNGNGLRKESFDFI